MQSSIFNFFIFYYARLAIMTSLYHYRQISITHSPFVVPLIDYWEEGAGIFLQLEFCPFGSLKSLLATNILDEKCIWLMLGFMIHALLLLDQFKSLHLDLKPENFLFDDGKRLRLADFGNCVSVDRKERCFSISNNIGTGAYAAPELYLFSQSQNDVLIENADMFSLGVVLFEMAADVEIPYRDKGWSDLRNFSEDDVLCTFVDEEWSSLFASRSVELRVYFHAVHVFIGRF